MRLGKDFTLLSNLHVTVVEAGTVPQL